MRDPSSEKPLSKIADELKRTQLRAASLGLVLAASLIGMAVINVEDEQVRRDEIAHVNDNPGGDQET